MSKRVIKIPFTTEPTTRWGRDDASAGSLIGWTAHNWDTSDEYTKIRWEPADYTLTGTMKVMGAGRGRSAVMFILRFEDGSEHVMRLNEMEHMLKTANINEGQICGVWGFAKQGANYTICYKGPTV